MTWHMAGTKEILSSEYSKIMKVMHVMPWLFSLSYSVALIHYFSKKFLVENYQSDDAEQMLNNLYALFSTLLNFPPDVHHFILPAT